MTAAGLDPEVYGPCEYLIARGQIELLFPGAVIHDWIVHVRPGALLELVERCPLIPLWWRRPTESDPSSLLGRLFGFEIHEEGR